MPKQSFAGIARDQLIRMPQGKTCCIVHELGALFKTAGSLTFKGGGKVQCAFRTENMALARRIMLLLKSRLQIVPSVYFVNHARLGGQKSCVLQLSEPDSKLLLIALHMMEEGADGSLQLKRMLPRRALTRTCCRRAFLRGAFLGSGYVSSPEKSYHLEIVAPDEAFAKMLVNLMQKSNLNAKIVDRKGAFIVYLKESQAIADFLTLIGAHDAVMRMEDIRVTKSVRNNVNRVMNCDHANMEKQLNASEKQTADIAALITAVGFDGLPLKLKDIAVLRLREPEASLKQLGEMLSPPLSKGGVSHRLRQIQELKEKMDINKGSKEETP